MKYVPCPGKGAKAKGTLESTYRAWHLVGFDGTLGWIKFTRAYLFRGRNAFALSVHTDGPKSTDPEECNRNNSHTNASGGAHTVQCRMGCRGVC